MKNLKNILSIFFLSLILAGCGTDSKTDEPENPNGLYDWDITENVISTETGKFSSQTNYIIYDKSEAYVIELKRNFDKCSTKYYRYQLIYHKRL